jgi:hypothetical protein
MSRAAQRGNGRGEHEVEFTNWTLRNIENMQRHVLEAISMKGTGDIVVVMRFSTVIPGTESIKSLLDLEKALHTNENQKKEYRRDDDPVVSAPYYPYSKI